MIGYLVHLIRARRAMRRHIDLWNTLAAAQEDRSQGKTGGSSPK